MSKRARSSSEALIAVAAGDGVSRGRVDALAAELDLPVLPPDHPEDQAFDLILRVTAERLELRETGPSRAGAVYVDFVGGATGFRRQSATSRRQPIAAACGLRGGAETVLDATAGLGQDAFLLASLGCTVTAVERSPVLAALLRDGIARANRQGGKAVAEIVRRITVIEADARDVLSKMPDDARPDVVYLDPMYQPRRKATVVKKQMRVCRALVGDDEDAAELWQAARRVAKRRVVVKRHRLAPPLAPNPVGGHAGTTVRYDVYPVTSTG